MSDSDGRDINQLLVAFGRRVYYEMKGEHGSPARAWFARILVLTVVLAGAGPILWNALLTMPTGLKVFIIAAIVGRIVLIFVRRHFRR